MTFVRLLSYLAVALVFTGLGLWLGRSETGQRATRAVQEAAAGAVVDRAGLGVRERVLLENPELIGAMREGGGFGGSSRKRSPRTCSRGCRTRSPTRERAWR
ncbi:MAG: hypothetical protein QNK04_33570 [Myxococcota bacterium]|nr:hypothetical protein [Myxococcota bacterium]